MAKTPKSSALILVGTGAVLMFLFLPGQVRAASLFVGPATGERPVAELFTVAVSLSAREEPVNAVSAILRFPPDLLRVVSVSKTGSALDLWIEDPSFSNIDGSVRFEGIVLNPGFQGDGKVLAITFASKAAGIASLTLQSAAILANDGKGTNVITEARGASYAIVGERYQKAVPPAVEPGAAISSLSHPEEGNWYNARHFLISWDLPAQAVAQSYIFGDRASAVPDTVPEVSTTQAAYNLRKLHDGQWHFHVRFKRPDGSWGAPYRRTAKVDLTPPEEFPIEKAALSPNDPRPKFRWSTVDRISGIAFYRVQVDNGEWADVQSLPKGEWYLIPAQAPGDHRISVQAYDHAGNVREAVMPFSVFAIEAPIVQRYSATIVEMYQPMQAEGTWKYVGRIDGVLRRDAEVKKVSTYTDSSGNWRIAHTDPLPPGRWEFQVVGIDQQGALSAPTTPLPVNVRLVDAFLEMLDERSTAFLAALIPLIAMFVIARLMMRRIETMRMELEEERARQPPLHQAS